MYRGARAKEAGSAGDEALLELMPLQDGNVPPRAGLPAAGGAAGWGPSQVAVPIQVPRPPQKPRALPILPHLGTHVSVCFAEEAVIALSVAVVHSH
jgi:hypothetical protein